MRVVFAILLLALAGLVPASEPVHAQGPAVEFMQEQIRQRDAERQRTQQRGQDWQRQRQQRQNERRRNEERRPVFRPQTPAGPTIGGQGERRGGPQEISDASPRVVELPKAADARVLLVVGDESAEALAQGLREAFASDTQVVVRAVTVAESGLAVREPVDWVARARDIGRTETNLLAVVVSMGMNDRRAIVDGQQAHAFRSDRWRELYQTRIDQFLQALVERRTTVYWAGLPAMRDPEVSAEASFVNEFIKQRAFAANVRFVDVWENFLDEEGRYVAIGPDVNGNQRRLRRPDGIGLTPAGARKLAFFVETEIRRDFSITAPQIATPEPAPADQPAPPPRVAEPERPRFEGPVVQLTPIQVRAGQELGSSGQPAPAADDIAVRVLVRGEAPPPRPGRADDFRWPPVDQLAGPVPAPAPEVTRAEAPPRP